MGSRLSRVAVAAAGVLALVASAASPAGAAESGAGAIDGEFVVTSQFPNPTGHAYPVLFLYGQLEVAGQTYDGGFTIAGMTAVEQGGGSGHCTGTAICPTSGRRFVGVDPGVARGFDGQESAVVGECRIDHLFIGLTGPFYFVVYSETMEIDCTASVLGGPPTAFTITANIRTLPSNIVGAYTIGPPTP